MVLFVVFFVCIFCLYLKKRFSVVPWMILLCVYVFTWELLWQLLKVSPVKLLMRGVCSVGDEWTILDKISWMTLLRSWMVLDGWILRLWSLNTTKSWLNTCSTLISKFLMYSERTSWSVDSTLWKSVCLLKKN